MYRKEQLRRQFGLTPLQAEDNLKAWQAIRDLLATLPAPTNTSTAANDDHALLVLGALRRVASFEALTKLLSTVLHSSTAGELTQVIKRLQGIRDSYLWPAETYPDAPVKTHHLDPPQRSLPAPGRPSWRKNGRKSSGIRPRGAISTGILPSIIPVWRRSDTL
jgi:hypothetical protein